MTPEFLRSGAPAAVLRALPGARAVGGAVRDHLAGRPIHDVDVAVALPPDEVTRLLRAAGLKVFETGLKHGTVTAVLDCEPVEVTSLRRDVATDGRHAEVEWIADWREDAARRDFTINAMSMGVDGVLHDHFGGQEDLRAGRVRFVGAAAERLAEDYLRALRFFRFWARYGRGEPDAAAVAAIREAVPGLARLSVERVWMELKRLLAADDPRAALRLMDELGVLGAVLPEAIPFNPSVLSRLLEIDTPVDFVPRLAALLPFEKSTTRAQSIAMRLKLSAQERLELLHAARQAISLPRSPHDSKMIRQLLHEIEQLKLNTHRAAERAILLREARSDWPGFEPWRGLEYALIRCAVAKTPVPQFPLAGADVVALGLEPGPEVGRLWSAVRDWWREGGADAPREACLAKLRKLANCPPA